MQGSSSKGVNDLCFHTYEEFSPPSSPPPWQHLADLGRIWQNLAKFGRNWKNLAGIGKNWQKLAEYGIIWQNLEGFGRIGEAEKKRGEEGEKGKKIPHTCASIGHLPLPGCCPKGEPTDRPTGRQSRVYSRVARDYKEDKLKKRIDKERKRKI